MSADHLSYQAAQGHPIVAQCIHDAAGILQKRLFP